MSNDPLSRAAEIVGGSRCETYGRPIDNHSCTAALWSAWLSRRLRTPITLTATDVCWFNILQKCSREANKHDDDNPVDVCGYAQNDWLCREADKWMGQPTGTGIDDSDIDLEKLEIANGWIAPDAKPVTHDEYKKAVKMWEAHHGVSRSQLVKDFDAWMMGTAPLPDFYQEKPPAAGRPMPEPQSVNVPIPDFVHGSDRDCSHMRLPNRVIYVHGPFTNGGKLDARARHMNTDKAIRAGIELTKKGWLPHIPHAATGCLDYTTDLSYEDYMELDNTMLVACGSGFRVEGPSSGGDRENRALRADGKPVWYNIVDVPDIRGQLRDAKIQNDE